MNVSPDVTTKQWVSGATEPFGVYVHWPFCTSKCPYCDFNSHVRAGGIDEHRFVEAICAELSHVASLTGKRPATSVFIGGGTPSLMSARAVERILCHIDDLWPTAPNAEITLEANPGSVEAMRFAGYRSAGINRVSLGIQSLRPEPLRALGRVHTVDEALQALATAQRTFERSSFDLIYARQGQTLAEWRTELEEALRLARGHLSLYQLTIEPATMFARLHEAGKLTLPDTSLAVDMYELTQELCEKAGMPAYEVSNHALPGEESRHNLLYWRYGAYAGCGPGAHGRVDIDSKRHATSTERNPERWARLVERQGHGFVETTELTCAEQADEMIVMGLRISEGLDLDALRRVTGHTVREDAVSQLVAHGLARTDGGRSRVRLTAAGRLVLNEAAVALSRGLVPQT